MGFQVECIGEYVSKPKFAQVFKLNWGRATDVSTNCYACREIGKIISTNLKIR